MASNDTKQDTSKSKGKDSAQSDADFLREAHDRYDAAWQRDRLNIERAYDDLAFLADENQWDPKARAQREAEGRPCLSFNALPTYTRQITGDMRQMRPAISCVPVDDHGDPETAEAFAGVIRYIENRSKAQAAVYAKGADSQVACGVGAWRIKTEYSSPATFNQDIKLELIEDAVMVLWDPDATELSRSDARFCHVPVDLSRAGFKARYPDKTPESYSAGLVNSSQIASWLTDDHVRISEYWFKKPAKHRLVLLTNGSVYDLDDPNEKRAQEAEQIVEQARAAGQIAKEDKRDIDEVWRAVISSDEVLEPPTKWPGRYIPIIPVFGHEITIGRMVHRFGAIRFAKDAQRAYNYSRTTQTEVVALQPKSPFLGTEKNFEEHEDVWETANTVNHPYLTYTPDPANGGAPPQRAQPPISSAGLAQEIELAAQDIQRCIGIFNAGLGAPSNETSGKAVMARQQEGDVGSMALVSNFSAAIEHTGTVLVDLIPHIYDTPRVLRIIGEDGKTEEVHINKPVGPMMDDAPMQVMNDLTVGAYDVSIAMGPSYSTKRQEARDGMRELIQAAPTLMPVIGDLYVRNQDWPGADDMADRLRAVAPPQIQALIQEETGKPLPAPPPDPMQQAAAQAEVQTKQGEARVKNSEADLKQADILLRQEQARKTKAEADLAEAQALAAMMPLQLDPKGVEQRFQILEHLLGQVTQALQPPPPMPQMTPQVAPQMPPGPPPGPMPPQPGAMPPQPQQPPPGGFSSPAPDNQGMSQ